MMAASADTPLQLPPMHADLLLPLLLPSHCLAELLVTQL